MKPLILALDTTHEFGSMALLRGEDVVEEITLQAPEGFAQILFGKLRDLLDRNGLKAADIACFAAASGPGSFTGVRIGLSCVKGLAEASGKPAVGVSNLRALAAFGSAPLRAPVIDARRGEIYGALYDAAGSLVMPEVVTKFDTWRATLPEGAEIVELTAGKPVAAAIGRIAVAQFLRGEAADPATLDANYVRRPDAELLFR